MKSNATGKPLGTDLNKLRALADADIATDDENPTIRTTRPPSRRSGAMPRSRRAVGGGDAGGAAPGARTRPETPQNPVDGALFARGGGVLQKRPAKAGRRGWMRRSRSGSLSGQGNAPP